MNNDFKILIGDIESKFNTINTEVVEANQVAFDFKINDIHGALSYIKSIGWRQLSLLTCVDWIADKEFELVYIVFNWENGIRVQLRTRINRDESKFITIINIYPGAKYYERDVHEFFGVKFEGNPDSEKQLFLEGWDDIPPFRKDFDSKAYSDRKYKAREYRVDYNTERGE